MYSAALIVAGLAVPMGSEVSTSSSGAVEHTSATLVESNGLSVLLVLAIPLLATVAVAVALRWRATTGGLAIAWGVTAMLAVFMLLAMLSIGVFVLPVTAALVAVCTIARRGNQPGVPAPTAG